MRKISLVISVLVCCQYGYAYSKPGSRVYIVTPAPGSSKLHMDEARSAPFYYHNWMRRIDTPNVTTTTPKVKTPDLIFAEFETDHTKNIRKLLEKERIVSTTTSTTSAPVQVPDEEEPEEIKDTYGLPVDTKPTEKDMTDYFALYNEMYNNPNNLPAPVYLPSTTPSTTTTTMTTTESPVNNVQNIWHIIDSEKQDQYSPQWDEVPISQENPPPVEPKDQTLKQTKNEDGDNMKMDDFFALPGFGTNPGIGGENESRAIRTEPNMRFPYVNLKPFQMKKTPMNSYNSKKGNNMLTSLDNFVDLKDPVRGEAQDAVPLRQHVDRYNPAQPYLPPSPSYGSNSKQSPSSTPMKAVANLVPPPPPPVPKITADDFPAPTSYESFPPYFGSGFNSAPAAPPMPPKPMSFPQPPVDTGDDSGPPGDDSDGPPGMGYDYQSPAPPSSSFLPTVPPMKMPPKGYSYERPPMDSPPPMEMDYKPYGYHYDKPEAPVPDKPVYGYHYSKPQPAPPAMDHPPTSYGPHESADYPELIYDGHHGGKGGDMKGGDMKNGDDMKDGMDDMGMVPPPPPPDMKPDMGAPPMDDSGFPSDFKYHHDFDDHDFYHHHHHHPTTTTTTTTTTEMPRVNRYSYYYLGKKLYYLPLYFSVYFIIYVGALIIKAVLRHKITYPNSFRPNDDTASFFSKRSVENPWDLSNEKLHDITGKVTHALATAASKYMSKNQDEKETD